MQDFSKRRRTGVTSRFLIQVGGAILLCLVAYIAVRAAYNMYGTFSKAAEAQAQAQEELEEVKSQKAAVGEAVEALDSRRGIEAQIRERYGVAKPGEGRIEIVRDGASTSPRVAGEKNIFVRFFDFIWPF